MLSCKGLGFRVKNPTLARKWGGEGRSRLHPQRSNRAEKQTMCVKVWRGKWRRGWYGVPKFEGKETWRWFSKGKVIPRRRSEVQFREGDLNVKVRRRSGVPKFGGDLKATWSVKNLEPAEPKSMWMWRIFCRILSVSQNIVMNLNNVMRGGLRWEGSYTVCQKTMLVQMYVSIDFHHHLPFTM